MTLLARYSGLATLVALLGCGSATEPTGPLGVPASATLPGVQLRIAASVSPSTVVAGQPLSLTYTITNVSRDTALVFFSCLGSAHRSLFLQSVVTQELVDKTPGCTPQESALVLAPNQTTTNAVQIETTKAGSALAAGRYVVDVAPSVTRVGLKAVQLQNLHAPFTLVTAAAR